MVFCRFSGEICAFSKIINVIFDFEQSLSSLTMYIVMYNTDLWLLYSTLNYTVWFTVQYTEPNRLSSTIDGNTECVHFQYSCLNVTSVNSNFLSDKTINKSDIFRLKCLSFSEISAIL